ncbi:hypothetical protein [Microlunatus speluncae]|uniref:hypothetical protein n=1 Tax=Microlunatus speluncae TaxID=2594267 RepID=UPI0012664731|nr:hypothetical protein [Microlunatus speluncae]
MPESTPTPRRTRRELLLTGGAALAAGTIGWAAGGDTAHALTGHSTLDSPDCKFYYEPTGNPVTLQFNDTFYNQLSTWKRWTSYNVPESWGAPVEVFSYGAYVNKPGMHGQGRAFDLGRYRFRNAEGITKLMSCRYDQWNGTANAELYRTRYWGLACSFARYFQHVLTYYDNADHHNHIHADNAVYGSPTNARYNTGSTSQTYILQAACRFVWAKGTAVDGDWGPETSAHSTEVLRRIGQTSGTVASSGTNWTAFCAATFRKAVGAEAY